MTTKIYPAIYINYHGKKKMVRGTTAYDEHRSGQCFEEAETMFQELNSDYIETFAVDANGKILISGLAVPLSSETRDKWHTLRVKIDYKSEPIGVCYVIPSEYAEFKAQNRQFHITIDKPKFTLFIVNGRSDEGRSTVPVCFRRQRDAEAYAAILERYHWDSHVTEREMTKTAYDQTIKQVPYYDNGHPDRPLMP